METPTTAQSAPQKEKFFRCPCLSTVALFAFFLALTIVLQWKAGAYQAEFGAEPDEAGHYVTGLFVRDFFAAGYSNWTHPGKFANDYYNHYPKVAIGHWGPTFYLVQAAWTLPFSPSRTSVLLLMATLTALTALLIFKIFNHEFGPWRAVAGALMFIAIPLVQQFSSDVMTEIPMAMLFLLAAHFFIRFLETERRIYSIAFGLVAATSILVKFSGYALALVPPLALIFCRRTYLFKNRSFWLSAIIVAIPALPWTLATFKLAADGPEKFGWSFSSVAIPYFAKKLFISAGSALLYLAAFGFIIRIFVRKKTKPAHATFGALLVAILFFVVTVPAGFEARHLVPAMPAVIFLAWAGSDWIAGWLSDRGMKPAVAMAFTFGVAILLFGLETFRIPHKGYAGFGEVAESLLKNPQAQKASFLVSSDARGEGMFISEVAMREKRPGHIVQRSSKKLASMSWSGGAYKMIYPQKPSDKKGQEFSTEEELLALLRKDSIGFFVFDNSIAEKNQTKHHKLLHATLDHHPETFSLEKSFTMERAGILFPNGIKLYRLVSRN